MPVAVQGGGTAAAEPPASFLEEHALRYGDVAEDARGASVVVAVDGAEAEAILVDSFVGASDGVAFGESESQSAGNLGLGWSVWKVERDKTLMLLCQKVASLTLRLQQEMKAGKKALI